MVRATHAGHGRYTAVAPGATALEHLRYGRIRLQWGDAPLSFGTGGLETGLICLSGQAEIQVGTHWFRLKAFDALYVPRDETVRVACEGDSCDLAEVSSDVENRYPMQCVRYEDVRANSGLHFEAGMPSCRRDLNILIGKNVEAGRIVAGVTFSDPGNWTSWPPHGAEMLEGLISISRCRARLGDQLVYTNPERPEIVTVVREGDCVVMPKGYHPNVAAPGGSIGFLWMMAAHREVIDRQFGVVQRAAGIRGRGIGPRDGKGGKVIRDEYSRRRLDGGVALVTAGIVSLGQGDCGSEIIWRLKPPSG